MTPHYDLKQQEKQQWCFGGWAGGGGVTNIFVIYLGGGSSMFFQRDWGCRQNFCLPHENVTAPPPLPHLVINDSSLKSHNNLNTYSTETERGTFFRDYDGKR